LLVERRNSADCVRGTECPHIEDDQMSRTSNGDPLRVLVVDDDAHVRTALRSLLEREGFNVDAVASGGLALRRNRSFAAEVVIMDTYLPDMSGIEATRRLLHEAPATSVLTLAVPGDDASVLDAVRAGSSGYLLKDIESGEIVAGVRAVATGDAAIDPRVAGVLVAEVREIGRAAARGLRPHPVYLSAREREMLELLTRGLRNVEIGQRLYVSPSTVKSELSRLFEKVGVENRVQAAAYAVRHGIADATRAAA
jgi:two-component system nitrate/nitrite response regulator NarL